MLNQQKTAIVFIHEFRNSSFSISDRALILALQFACHFNPEIPVFLVANESSIKKVNDLMKRYRNFASRIITESIDVAEKKYLKNIFLHDGLNNYHYELFCFERFLILKNLLLELPQNNVLYVDSDLLLTTPINNIFYNLDCNLDCYLSEPRSSYLSFWSLAGLENLLESFPRYFKFCLDNQSQRISDMHAVEYFTKNNIGRHKFLTPKQTEIHIKNLRVFLFKNFTDDKILDIAMKKINQMGGEQCLNFFPEEKVKNIFTLNKDTGFLYSLNKKVSFIHLQGSAKVYISLFDEYLRCMI